MQAATSRSVVSGQWPVLEIGTSQTTLPEGLERGVWGVSGTYSPSLRPVNQGTTSQTRSSGGGVETNSCQETTGDLATAVV